MKHVLNEELNLLTNVFLMDQYHHNTKIMTLTQYKPKYPGATTETMSWQKV